jgi:hypothetical protein
VFWAMHAVCEETSPTTRRISFGHWLAAYNAKGDGLIRQAYEGRTLRIYNVYLRYQQPQKTVTGIIVDHWCKPGAAAPRVLPLDVSRDLIKAIADIGLHDVPALMSRVDARLQVPDPELRKRYMVDFLQWLNADWTSEALSNRLDFEGKSAIAVSVTGNPIFVLNNFYIWDARFIGDGIWYDCPSGEGCYSAQPPVPHCPDERRARNL